MPHYTKYYRFDAFFSHCSDDNGWYPSLFAHFPQALGEAFKARTIIANKRITRDPRGGGPQIHAVGREVGHLAANGELFDPLYKNARDSFIFVALIGNNYLISEACLTELLGFLESKRDPKALHGSLFLSLLPGVERAQLFDLASNPDLNDIPDVEEHASLKRLSTAISQKLRELYGRPQNLISMPVPKPDSERDPAELAGSLARKFATWIATTLEQSCALVDPERADDDCREGRAYPLVVLRSTQRPAPVAPPNDGVNVAEHAGGADPAENAIRALEQLSEELSEETSGEFPLRGYPISTQKLLHYADGTSVSPFDPLLPKPPRGLIMTREAVGAFPAPQATLLSKLSRDFGTLQIAIKPPAPVKGVLVTLGADGATLLEPQTTVREFVKSIQLRYR